MGGRNLFTLLTSPAGSALKSVQNHAAADATSTSGSFFLRRPASNSVRRELLFLVNYAQMNSTSPNLTPGQPPAPGIPPLQPGTGMSVIHTAIYIGEMLLARHKVLIPIRNPLTSLNPSIKAKSRLRGFIPKKTLNFSHKAAYLQANTADKSHPDPISVRR